MNISDFLTSSADAMDNLFEVSFSIEDDSLTELSFRISEFTPPELKRETSNYAYKGLSITKPISSIDLNRTLKFNIRLDANYAIYKKLKDIFNKTVEEALSPGSLTGFTIEVKALNEKEERIMSWKFNDALITSLYLSKYSHDNQSGPQFINLNLIYSDFEESFKKSL